jgi:CBS domain-containing protein
MATVGEIMSKDLITVDPQATVAEAATIMGEHHAGSALVMDGGSLAGIFTERDIVRALGEHFDAAGHPVSNWMTREPVTIEAEATVQDALDRMLSGGFRHLPVMEGGRVVGLVSMRDLSKATSGA